MLFLFFIFLFFYFFIFLFFYFFIFFFFYFFIFFPSTVVPLITVTTATTLEKSGTN